MKNLFTIEPVGNRIYGLDILRAVAILFVIVGHGRYILPEPFRRYHDYFVFDGVSIFFVLSGYLIGGILIKILQKGNISWNILCDFWIRRWFRTLPNYFLILIVLLALNYVFNDGYTLNSVKSYFIFSQNLFYPHPNFFPEAWSLTIEEWFYIVVPFALFLCITILSQKPSSAILTVAVLIIIGVIIFRLQRYSELSVYDLSEWDKNYRKQVITRIDSLMYGVIAAYIAYYYNKIWRKNTKLLLIFGIAIFAIHKFCLLAGIFSYIGFFNCVLSFSITSLATALLLPNLSSMQSGKGMIAKTLTIISLISYSMYLINLSLIQQNLLNKIPWNNYIANGWLIIAIKYLLFWILTILGSILLYKYFEVPTTKLRDNPWIKRSLLRITATNRPQKPN